MNKTQIGNSELISQLNSRLVLQAVRVMQPTFRAEVARRTGLKPATVTVIVNDLLRQRMLQEIPGPTDNDRWGRPPLMLQVNGDVKRILTVDLEPDRIRVALLNLSLEQLVYHEQLIDRFAKPKAICSKILKLCEKVLEDTEKSKILGIGVSLPGIIDVEHGILISSTNMPNWHNVPVKAILEEELRLPVIVERSVRLAALYELWTHPHLQDQTTVILSLRTGVGFSLINRGQVYVGNSGFDGEVGHTVVEIGGRQCECGNRGCLETFISASAICDLARQMITDGRGGEIKKRVDQGETLTPELIYSLARTGDKASADIVKYIGRYLGIAIANLINLLSPHEVVICGSIDMVEELLLESVKEQVAVSALPRTRENTVIRIAEQRERLPLLGAAVAVAQQIFELPRLTHSAVAGAEV